MRSSATTIAAACSPQTTTSAAIFFATLRAANNDWFMAGYLAERMGAPPAETHWMYLHAAWADESVDPARSERYLALAFERFVLAERTVAAGSQEWWVARLMQIEIDRRLGRFEEADRLLAVTDMASAPADYRPMVERQTQLVAARDSSVPIGAAWNYPSWGASDTAALNKCGHRGCKVMVQFANGCGAIAESADHKYYYGGSGRNRAEAERDAMDRLTNWMPSPPAMFGSSAPPKQSVHVRYSECTAGA